MHIRAYRSGDLEAMRDLTVDAFQGVSIDHNIEAHFGMIHGHDWRWRKARHIDADVAANADGAFVAEENGVLMGYVTTLVDVEAGIGQIPNLAVAAAARNRGLGRQLIEHALDYFRGLGLAHAKIETLDQNPIGQHLYPACGFREVARQIHYVMDLKVAGPEHQPKGLRRPPQVDVPSHLIEAIRAFPRTREVEHCDHKLVVSPFDMYATCPHCGRRIKLRSFSAAYEIEDVFDAVFEWMQQPGAVELVRRRQQAIAADREE